MSQPAAGDHASFHPIGMACFFLFCWLAVFDSAFMNGDDAVHYASSLQSSLLPRLHNTWTPNRVVDTYGRSLLSSVFGFLFFSANGITHVGFMTLYKIVSASLFAVFAVFGLSYLLRQLPEVRGGSMLRWTIALLMAVLFFQVFGWRNQVHFICYQLPSLLTFALLKITVDGRDKEMDVSGMSGFVLLSYLCAFSLESIAATILVFSVGLLAFEWRRRRERIGRIDSSLKLIVINICFSVCALVVTFLFSERSKEVAYTSDLAGMKLFSASSVMLVGVALVFSGAGLFVCQRRCKAADDARFAADLLFALGLVAATLVTTYAVSIKAGTNYFSLTDYPWGDLMLTGKLACLYALGLVAARLAAPTRGLQPVVALV